MKSKLFLIFLFVCVLFSVSNAQKKETFYYDKNWKGVATKEEAEYYRVASFDVNGKPIGEIKDYYITGEIQGKIESAKFINKFDDEKSIFVGKTNVFYKNGKLSQVGTLNSNGKKIGEFINYYESGSISGKADFDEQGVIIRSFSYGENGQIAEEISFKNGLIDGTRIVYNRDGQKRMEIEYINGKEKNDWYLYYDDNGNVSKYNIKTNKPFEVENNKNEKISTLKLTSDGKLKNTGDGLGDIKKIIPAGATVDVYEKLENGYYKVKYEGIIGYVSEVYFSENKNFVKNPSTQEGKQVKSFVRDGITFQYYIHKGISITMKVNIDHNYGKYFMAFIAIENLTGKAFDFNPEEIEAATFKNNERTLAEVLSSYEYMRRVSNRQAFNSALVAFGETMAASNAGYSTSTTNTNITGYSNNNVNISGYYGNNYGALNGTINTNGSANIRSTTQTYNAGVNYAAQQIARKNVNDYQSQQFQIRKEINQGYLKYNTIENEQRVIGYINIIYRTAESLKIIVPVNGNNYEFIWSAN